MPNGPNYNTGRPPRRKSWDENADKNDDPDQNNNDLVADRPKAGSAKPSLASDWRGEAAKPSSSSKATVKDNEEKKVGAKNKRKRLLNLLGSEALCLIIVFSLISTFNWMATDYSGDYMGQSDRLRMVRLSVTRRATTVDAELSYGQLGALDLDQSQDQPAPQEGKALSLDFATPIQWRRPGKKLWRANFNGRIGDGKAVGTISDITGHYKVHLEKNVLTSLFTQLQAHIPRIPAMPLPTFFNEKEQRQNAGTVQPVQPIQSKNETIQGSQAIQRVRPMPPSRQRARNK